MGHLYTFSFEFPSELKPQKEISLVILLNFHWFPYAICFMDTCVLHLQSLRCLGSE